MSKISTKSNRILIVDDKQKIRESLSLTLENRGFHTFTAGTVKESWILILEENINMALVDIRLGNENGLDLLQKIQMLDKPFPVIMFTGYGTIESAIEAIKLGAFNYLQKPVKTEQLVTSINSALKINYLEDENRKLHNKINKQEEILVSGETMTRLENQTRKLAATELPILIQGESGTGKEMFADLIHKSSSRCNEAFVKINCAALPESLLDDELFGHEKGSFTGASGIFKGVFERADKGTLFLDELGDMSLSTQAKILRAIQNHEIKRIGGSRNIRVDVRFIAATNKKLEVLIEEKTFREDLYYRLSTAVLHIPPLRERRNEIIPLANHFLSTAGNASRPDMVLAPETVEFLQKYDWPGNVRELKSSVQYASALSGSAVIRKEDLPHKISSAAKPGVRGSLHKEMEEDLIIRVLKECGNNKKKAAENLGISRATLYNKIREYHI